MSALAPFSDASFILEKCRPRSMPRKNRPKALWTHGGPRDKYRRPSEPPPPRPSGPGMRVVIRKGERILLP